MRRAIDIPDLPSALYERVKHYVMARVQSGEWPEGGRVPSENDLVRQLGVARMTVNRAMRELSAAGILVRVKGSGTFVCKPPPRAALLEIRDIAEEIAARGCAHRATVVTLEALRSSPDLAALFDVHPGARILHSVIIHHEDGVPLQLEERFVSAAFAPDYLNQDFSTQTTNHYLQCIAPPSELEHVVFAAMPDERMREWLKIDANEACLVLARRTWVDGLPVTRSVFTHPGSRYSLAGRSRLGAGGDRG